MHPAIKIATHDYFYRDEMHWVCYLFKKKKKKKKKREWEIEVERGSIRWREREREIGYACKEPDATYYFRHGTNCYTPY